MEQKFIPRSHCLVPLAALIRENEIWFLKRKKETCLLQKETAEVFRFVQKADNLAFLL